MKRLKESTRKELLLSASNEFARNGYVKANVDTISVKAGYGKGTIYNYFKSKLELFLTVVKESVNELVDEINSNIKNISDPMKRFEIAISTDFEHFSKKSDLFITIIKESYTADKEKLEQFIDATNPLFDTYLGLFAEGVKSGFISEDINSVSAVIMLMGMIENLSISNKILGNALGSSDELSKRIFNILIHGIKTSEVFPGE